MEIFNSYREAAQAKIRYLGDSGGGAKLKAIVKACDTLRNKPGSLDLENQALAVMLLLEALDHTHAAAASAEDLPRFAYPLLGLEHPAANQPKTPAAEWRQHGLEDPHGDHYQCERAQLAMGNLTDDQIANGVYMNGQTGGNGYSAIGWVTAAKERIRWLSRKVIELSKAQQEAQG